MRFAQQDIALREFHVSRNSRDRYQFEKTLFNLRGNVIFADFHAARVFAQKMNAKRDLINYPERAVRAGQLNALGLIDEILHYVIRLYQEQRNPQVMEKALAYLEAQLSPETISRLLKKFCDDFPPIAVYQRELTVEEYLEGETAGVSNRAVALEELLMLWLSNLNPAFDPFFELFDDSDLEKTTAYHTVMETLHNFFDTQPFFGPENQNLIDMLRIPALRHPHSLEEQLDFIRTRWIGILGAYLYRLLSSLDFLAEEGKLFFGFGPGPEALKPYDFGEQEFEPERFSPDSDWMPRLVLLAKNVYVWLDQLSKEYEQDIYRLDQVPDAELDKLARWGVTGLWLIGLWQRSEASKRIKQIMGNPEAVASAYSLEDYRIADDLGGEAAFNDLKARAWRRGVRMASDMVPNHMGIDSRWLIEHPDWFIGLDYPPFPNYTFNGVDLCDDPRVGVYIEDHYYTRSDAAVVFKRVDHWSGATRYIYHGNDGTSMPWNDTAQLNYLKAEVREAVIQTILDVARRSPIIRFDAAMTLAKKHYQRLWFPEPGTGGDIPSRAGFGMTREEFDAAMPEEFWREVVDRVQREVPDTLLLAEAFWLMEGYFVRSLGMHRVYNSAFMNMLRDEKNAEYRQLIKNTLEFDPQILKRYVNFMNNPDERTATDQFGKGDKYFGVCTLMITLPGLPMFGHGQVEGYAEKYGMEFRKAYWNESPDPWLVERHEREVFPLLHKRYLFAEVADFLLLDFYTPQGQVDENVFAYANRAGDERSLVLYHNKYADTSGWIRTSAAYAVKQGDGEKVLVQKTLATGLGIPNDGQVYLIFRDAISGLEYIRNCREIHEHGLYAELHAYQAHVFLDFREVGENEYGQYGQLHAYLNGRGVPSIHEAMQELFLEPVHQPLRMLISAPAFEWLMQTRETWATDPDATAMEQVELKVRDLLKAVNYVAQAAGPVAAVALDIRQQLEALFTLAAEPDRLPLPEDEMLREALLAALTGSDPTIWSILLSWLFIAPLGRMVEPEEGTATSRTWVDEWLLGKVMANALREMDVTEEAAWRAVATLKLLIESQEWYLSVEGTPLTAYAFLHRMLRERDVQHFLGVNRYQDVLWFNQEHFEAWVFWLTLLAIIEIFTAATSPAEAEQALAEVYALAEALLKAEAASDYRVERLLEAARQQAAH